MVIRAKKLTFKADTSPKAMIPPPYLLADIFFILSYIYKYTMCFWNKKYLKIAPPSSAPLADKKIEKNSFRFFIRIEPTCSELKNFDKKKQVVADLPDTCISNISMVVLTNLNLGERHTDPPTKWVLEEHSLLKKV